MTLWAGATNLLFLQLANDLHDSALINDLHSRLRKMANTVDDIHHKVDDVYHKVDNIETFLSKLKRSGTQPGSDSLARQEMPLKPEIFHGRDELVEDIAQLLVREETSRVCILGPGGMGKTSVSLAVVELPLIKERFPGGNTVWVPCIEATSATLFLEILHIQLQLPGDKQVTLDKVISELDAQKQPRLIVVDNFETPWNGNQKQVGDIIRRLAMLSHIAILVTMRGSHPPCDKAIKWQAKDIESTDEAACLRVYHDINPNSENDPDVARLLSALGHMPFAVTLMARLGLESQWSAKALLDAWSESGPDMLSNDPEQSMNRSIGLSVESELVKRNPNAGLLLAILSLLPAGTTSENLHWWAPEVKMSMIPSAIATLSQAALLVENKRENSASPVLFVIPVVQSFMQQQNRITQEVRKKVHSLCCEYVLAHACRQDDPTFADKSKALAAEDANIQSILFGSPQSQVTAPSHTTMEALIAFSWYRCDTKPNLETAKHAVMAAKATEVQRYIALALWCLGMTCFRLARNFDSFTYMREAFRIFYNHLDGEVELIRLGVLCGIDFLGGIMQFGLHSYISSSVDENLNLEIDWARMMVKKCATISDHDSDDLVHGCSLLSLGIALNNAQQRQEALCHMDHARTIFVAVGHTFHLARAYQAISRVHLNEHRLRDALDAIEEAWKYAESTASRYIQISVSLDFGKILFSNDQDTKAWKHIEIALMNASYIGQRNIFGPALDYMGYGYLRRGDYQNAYGAYEAASPAYIRGSINLPAAKLCEDNMSKIKWKQENPDAIVGFYRPTGDVDTTLFYPSVQSFASELSVSHS